MRTRTHEITLGNLCKSGAIKALRHSNDHTSKPQQCKLGSMGKAAPIAITAKVNTGRWEDQDVW